MKIKFSEKIISSKCLKDINDIIKKDSLLMENILHYLKRNLESLQIPSILYCFELYCFHLSCLAAGFSKGDEVIVPAMTHTATSHAIEYTGAKAIFCDVDSKTGNLTIENLKKNLKDQRYNHSAYEWKAM